MFLTFGFLLCQGYGQLPSLDGPGLAERERRLNDMKNGLRKARAPANLIVELEQALMVVNHFRTASAQQPSDSGQESSVTDIVHVDSADRTVAFSPSSSNTNGEVTSSSAAAKRGTESPMTVPSYGDEEEDS